MRWYTGKLDAGVSKSMGVSSSQRPRGKASSRHTRYISGLVKNKIEQMPKLEHLKRARAAFQGLDACSCVSCFDFLITAYLEGLIVTRAFSRAKCKIHPSVPGDHSTGRVLRGIRECADARSTTKGVS